MIARTWLVATSFALSWCLASSALAQNDRDKNQDQAQSQPQQANQNPSANSGAQPNGSRDNAIYAPNPANTNPQAQQASNSQQQRPRSTQPSSGAKADQDANIAPTKNQSSSEQQAAGSRGSRNKAGNLAQWTVEGPRNEFIRLKAFAHTVPLSLAPVDESLRAHLGLPDGEGLLVTAVDPGSPAFEAGVRQNDILIKLGDRGPTEGGSPHSLATPESFYNRLKELGDGPVSLTLLRDGKPSTIHVQPKTEVTLHPVTAKTPSRDFWIGVTVTAIEPALRAQLQLPPHGLIVTGVGEASPAARAGIVRHDILLDIDGQPLSEPASLAESVQAKGEKPIVLNLIRKGKDRIRLILTPERKKPASPSAANALQNNQNLSFQILQPGVLSYPTANMPILNVPQPGGGSIWFPNTTDPLAAGNPYLYPQYASQFPPPAAADPSSSIAKRLDALDAELKELRAAVIEYKQTAKALEELNKALSESLKAIKMKN